MEKLTKKIKHDVGKQQLWASRFKKTTDPVSKQYSESITIDRPMFYHSVYGSEVHVIMLAYQNIIKDNHAREILEALQKIKKDFEYKKWDLQLQEEDVQMNIERYVIDTIGIESGGRMHTTRSRNDQVPLDTKLYVRDELVKLIDNMTILIEDLLDIAKNHTHTIMPGYTHTQHAQPMTYAYWLTHHAAVFLRDTKRLLAAYDCNDLNPLGAGAITGTSFPIDRKLTTRLLGFHGVNEHALDAIGNQDSMLEIISALAILFSTFSRIAEEIIISITYEFDTMVLDDGFAMGSSMMPQKKNPGVLELVRGRTGKMYGILMHALTMMKGLPSGYNRDYHEVKTTQYDALKLANETVELLSGVLHTLTIKPDRMKYIVNQNFATATELANYLVRVHDIPFRLCHRIVGYVVKTLVDEGKNFTDKERTKQLLAEKDILITDEDYDNHLDPEKVIVRYISQGGTAPKEVTRMIREMSKINHKNMINIQTIKERLQKASNETKNIVLDILGGTSVEDAVNSIIN